GLRLFGCDRTRGVSGLPRQVFLARGVTERAPDRHRPLAWPLDSAVGVEASFAGQFTCTLLVWIGSVHGIALGYYRLPTQPRLLREAERELHYQKVWRMRQGQLRCGHWVRGRAVNKRRSPRSAHGCNTSTCGRSASTLIPGASVMEIYGVRSWRMAAGTCQGQPRQVGDEHLGATDRPRNRGKDELRADVLPTRAEFVETLGRSAQGRNQSLRRRACRLSLAGFWFSAARAFSAIALFAVCSTADTRCGSHRVIPNEPGECSLTNDPLSNRSAPM